MVLKGEMLRYQAKMYLCKVKNEGDNIEAGSKMNY